jgi:phage protein D/phage baseplate assembly protein gpV
MFTIRVQDVEFKWLEDARFGLGKKVEISMADGGGALTSMLTGEITMVEMDMTSFGPPSYVLQGYSKAHRLHRGRHSESYLNVSDADLVRKVAGRQGLSTEIDSTPTVNKYVFQNNQTDWEFLTERARRIDFNVYVHEDKLCFKKSTTAGGGITVTYGTNLRSLHVTRNLHQDVDKVTVHGWDPAQKKQIVGTATRSNIVPSKFSGKAKQAFGSDTEVVISNRPVHSQDEAQKMAQGVLEELASTNIECEGLCDGMPDMKPGSQITINNIGSTYNGTYSVTSVTHIWSPQEGFTTSFVVSGRTHHSLAEALGVGPAAQGRTGSSSNPGVFVGIVTNNDDPDKMGRVKVKIPMLTEDHESNWARVVMPMAGPGRGFYILPEINDEVLVAFEHGDIHRPYVIGAIWNGSDKLPEESVLGSGGTVDRRVLYTRAGHKMDFDDTQGSTKFTLTTAGGHKILMDDGSGKKLAMTTDGGHKVDMDDTGKKITVKSTGGHKVEMDDTANKMTVTDSAGDKAEFDAMQGKITMSSNLQIDVKSTNINIEATAMLTLKGATVDMNGSLATNIKGLIVKIN